MRWGRTAWLRPESSASPLASPWAAASQASTAAGPSTGNGAVPGSIELVQHEEGQEPYALRVYRRAEPVRRHVGGQPSEISHRVACPGSATGVREAERGVASELGVGERWIPDEVAGRIGADHDHAAKAFGIAPHIDQLESRAVAAAEKIDPAIAQRPTSRFLVVHGLRHRIAREVDPLACQPCGAKARTLRVAGERRGAHERALGGGDVVSDLRAVEFCAAVDAAISDHDDVVPPDQRRNREVNQVGRPWPPLEGEDGLFRRVLGVDADQRQGDQPASRNAPMLRHDELTTVGGEVPTVGHGSIHARMEAERTGFRGRLSAGWLVARSDLVCPAARHARRHHKRERGARPNMAPGRPGQQPSKSAATLRRRRVIPDLACPPAGILRPGQG